MRRHADPAALLPLSAAAFHILLSLAAGERHGYSIAKEVAATSGERVRLGPTTLYRLLRQMRTDGWIAETDGADPNDPRRRSYRLTDWGRAIAQAESARHAEVVRVARARALLPAGTLV